MRSTLSTVTRRLADVLLRLVLLTMLVALARRALGGVRGSARTADLWRTAVRHSGFAHLFCHLHQQVSRLCALDLVERLPPPPTLHLELGFHRMTLS